MNLWAVLKGDGTFSLEVVGVSSCQIELEEICQGDPAVGQEQITLALLIPEETNPYRSDAVRVQVWKRIVGYLSRPDAQAFRACLNREVPGVSRYRCRAKIQHSRNPREGAKEHWGVWLDVCLKRGLAAVLTSPYFLAVCTC